MELAPGLAFAQWVEAKAELLNDRFSDHEADCQDAGGIGCDDGQVSVHLERSYSRIIASACSYAAFATPRGSSASPL